MPYQNFNFVQKILSAYVYFFFMHETQRQNYVLLAYYSLTPPQWRLCAVLQKVSCFNLQSAKFSVPK